MTTPAKLPFSASPDPKEAPPMPQESHAPDMPCWEQIPFAEAAEGDLIRYREGELIVQGRISWKGFSAWDLHKFKLVGDILLGETSCPGDLHRHVA